MAPTKCVNFISAILLFYYYYMYYSLLAYVASVLSVHSQPLRYLCIPAPDFFCNDFVVLQNNSVEHFESHHIGSVKLGGKIENYYIRVE